MDGASRRLALTLVVQPVRAQTTTTDSNTATGTINASTPCSSPLVRNISVSGSFTVADVDLGVLVTHTWRGDLRITLQSPAGGRVQLVDGDTASLSADNGSFRRADLYLTSLPPPITPTCRCRKASATPSRRPRPASTIRSSSPMRAARPAPPSARRCAIASS